MFFFNKKEKTMGAAALKSSIKREPGATAAAAAAEADAKGKAERRRLLGRLLALHCFYINNKNTKKANRFVIGNLIGYGSFGEVSDCVDLHTGHHYAIKVMERGVKMHSANTAKRRFLREVGILSKLNHQNIVKLHDYFQDRKYFYCVLEKCRGLSLSSFILKQTAISERTAANLCKQMLEALCYLHSLGIMHRDIKAENFMFASTEKDARLILLDFGISVVVDSPAPLNTICGSLHYLSPEVLCRVYSFAADVWSLGVLLFVMLYRRFPFTGSSTYSTCKRILSGKIDYTEGPAVPSPLAVDFISSLLAVDQRKRLTAQQALQHKWIIGGGQEEESASSREKEDKEEEAKEKEGEKAEAEEEEEKSSKTTNSVFVTETGTREDKQTTSSI